MSVYTPINMLFFSFSGFLYSLNLAKSGFDDWTVYWTPNPLWVDTLPIDLYLFPFFNAFSHLFFSPFFSLHSSFWLILMVVAILHLCSFTLSYHGHIHCLSCHLWGSSPSFDVSQQQKFSYFPTLDFSDFLQQVSLQWM